MWQSGCAENRWSSNTMFLSKPIKIDQNPCTTPFGFCSFWTTFDTNWLKQNLSICFRFVVTWSTQPNIFDFFRADREQIVRDTTGSTNWKQQQTIILHKSLQKDRKNRPLSLFASQKIKLELAPALLAFPTANKGCSCTFLVDLLTALSNTCMEKRWIFLRHFRKRDWKSWATFDERITTMHICKVPMLESTESTCRRPYGTENLLTTY